MGDTSIIEVQASRGCGENIDLPAVSFETTRIDETDLDAL